MKTDMTKLTVAFGDSASAPKDEPQRRKGVRYCVLGTDGCSNTSDPLGLIKGRDLRD